MGENDDVEYRISDTVRASVMMRNLTNRENIRRPGDLLAPWTLSVPLGVRL